MSATLIWLAFVVAALVVVAIPVAWYKSPRHQRWSEEKLRLQSESDMRRDVQQAILGIGAVLAIVGSAGTFYQNQEKLNQEQRQRLLTSLASESTAAQTDAIHQLLRYWQDHEPDGNEEHMRVLASFLKARAPIPFKHEAVLDKWKYDEEIKPVERVRPAVQAAVWALSELNRNRHPKSSEPRFQLKDVDLRHLPMQGLHLQNLDLSSALLVGADLSSCDLSNSKVYSTFIMSANFTGAILSGADFRFSRVDPSTTFSGATVQNTDFSGSQSGKEGDQNRITELTVNPDVIGKPAAFGEWKFRLDPKK